MNRNLNRRNFLKAVGIGAAGLAIPGCPSASEQLSVPAQKHKRPNLIYVLADQLGYIHCGYAGSKKAHTPNIDKLASQGANFRNAVSNMPVCAAYRASLFTGKYPTTTGMVINELRMNTNHECFGHVLTRSGYEAGYIGKWHLYANQLGHHNEARNSFVPPGPDRLGFDGYWAAYNFHHNYYSAYYHTNSPKKISYGQGVYEPDAQTNLAISFLQNAAKSTKPFATFLSYGTPHDPWSDNNVPKKYRDMFKGVRFPNPPNYKDENDKYADAWGRLSPQQREELEHWRRNYYAMTSNLDWNIGRLLDAVDRAGISDNTIIVFTSDHGEMFGAHGRRAKNIFYEEAARVPFLISWSKHIPAGTISDACLGTVDITPTILSLMDLPVPKDVEGADLSRCALGKKGPEPEAAFLQNTGACAAWQNGHEWRALRDKQYTYAQYHLDKSELLFDNVADPYQMTNLASKLKYKSTIVRFRKMLADKMNSLNDNFEQCTWYRDNWTDGNRVILRGAKG
ncbi:MAG: sulfatase-like hydrolase/transferase [Planctomycetota bacterium]|jgi:arylsulfatase A-like enzyme